MSATEWILSGATIGLWLGLCLVGWAAERCFTMLLSWVESAEERFARLEDRLARLEKQDDEPWKRSLREDYE